MDGTNHIAYLHLAFAAFLFSALVFGTVAGAATGQTQNYGFFGGFIKFFSDLFGSLFRSGGPAATTVTTTIVQTTPPNATTITTQPNTPVTVTSIGQIGTNVSVSNYSLNLTAGQWGEVTLAVNPTAGTSWWVYNASKGLEIRVSNGTNGSVVCSTSVVGCSNKVAVYSFESNTVGNYTAQLRLGHTWAQREYYVIAFIHVRVVPSINLTMVNIAVNLIEEISNAKAAGFNVTEGMFSANSATQCAKELISACNNNNPKQYICVNTAYAADIAQQYKSIYTKPVICPMYIIANFIGCGVVNGYCVVTSKNAGASTVPITTQP